MRAVKQKCSRRLVCRGGNRSMVREMSRDIKRSSIAHMGVSTIFSEEGLVFRKAQGRLEHTKIKSYFSKFVLDPWALLTIKRLVT